MNKRAKMDFARMVQIQIFNLTEMPEDYPRGKSIRGNARKQGYHYLRLTVEDLDTGERAMRPLFTIRKTEEYADLFSSLLNVTDWPREFLDQIHPAVYVGGEEWVDGTKTARQIHDKQLSGGRPRQNGILEDKAKEYEGIIRAYQKSKLSEREFCNEMKISRSKLYRAKKHVKSQSQTKAQ